MIGFRGMTLILMMCYILKRTKIKYMQSVIFPILKYLASYDKTPTCLLKTRHFYSSIYFVPRECYESDYL